MAPDRRPSASDRGYDWRWRKARDSYLAKHPLCVECVREGRTVAATVVDHIEPHKGDQVKFWDQGNWQSLCKTHHNVKTAREDGGFGNAPGARSVGGCGADGLPIDSGHPWNVK